MAVAQSEAVQTKAMQTTAEPTHAEPIPLVAARGLGYAAGGRWLVRDVELEVFRGEIVTLIGPNGAGKTTLVRLLLGVLSPGAGHVERLPELRVGYVPQRVYVDPSLPLTVGRFLAIGRPAVGRSNSAALEQTLDEVGCAALTGRSVHSLSGGEFQRVLLARALLRDPHLLILDEPVQGVDVGGQLDLYALIGRLRTARGYGVLLVSHDLHLVMAATDRVLCLNGHVCCSGPPAAVVKDPAYLDLFGPRAAGELALYTHHHDHIHHASSAAAEGDAGDAAAAGGPKAQQ